MGKQKRSEALHLMIERCAENRELIEVHAEDQSDGVFYCGRIIEISEAGFRLQYVDPLGVPGSKGVLDGWFRFDEIGFIRRDTPYVRGLAKLVSVHERFSALPATLRGHSRAGSKKLAQRLGGHRASVVEALGMRDAHGRQPVRLFERLDAFGGHI